MVVSTAMNRCVLVCVLSLCSAQQSAYVTITPTVLTLEHNMTSRGGLVTVLCRGSAGSDASLNLYSLKMSRVLDTHPNATPTTLLNILHHNLSPQVIYPIEGSSSTGSVTQHFLTLRMTQARCHDAGVYICEAAYLNNDIVTHTADDSLSVTVNPGQLTVTSEPDFEHWAVNNTVTLTCTGPLGTVQSDSQIKWHWEFWDTDNYSWQSYDGPSSDVTVQATNQLPCYKNGSSTLVRRLQLADSRRVYRCYVTRDDVPFPHFAGRFQFGYVLAVSNADTAQEEYDKGFVVGAAVGVGATAGFAVVVVTIVCCCLKKHRLLCAGTEPRKTTSSQRATNAKRITPKTPNRNVALQTVIDDDSYDVINDNMVAPKTSTPRAARVAATPPIIPRNDSQRHGGDDAVAATAQEQLAAAEDVLHSLLTTRYVTSWKVGGEGGHTSFILHLAPSSSDVIHRAPHSGDVTHDALYSNDVIHRAHSTSDVTNHALYSNDVTEYQGQQLGRWHKKRNVKKQHRSAKQGRQLPTQQTTGVIRVSMPYNGMEQLEEPGSLYGNLRR